MTLPLIAILFLSVLVLGYFLYGRLVEKEFAPEKNNQTPAHRFQDGVDFVPTRPFYLFAQHFSAIAAAGPIAGPIIACQAYGWLPCLLWIALGVVLIGAVHDFSSLAASVKHEAHSIADIAGHHLGKKAGLAMGLFIWIALIYIIVAFSDITAASFVTKPEELMGLYTNFNPGGAVAWASLMYLFLSITLGLVERFLNPPLWLTTIIFVPATFLICWCGTYFSEWFLFSHLSWSLIIVIYCAIASLLPVWLLLQPRGYLGGFVLYSVLAVGLFGLFFSGKSIEQPMIADMGVNTAPLFPFLFVSIACGACSGFHGLVCSGTTSKQIDKETHVHPIGYGAMLAEGMVALISLSIIMTMSPTSVTGLKPGAIYGKGIGEYLTLIIGKDKLPFAITFGAMAFSTFVFDTLDVSARLGRYLFQELTGLKGKMGAALGTILTVGFPTLILVMAKVGMWGKFWTLFGAANQLLAALTLLTITCWLYQARKRIAYTLFPMLFVLITTLTALAQMCYSNWKEAIGFDVFMINSIASLLLILLSIYIVGLALFNILPRKNKLACG